MFCGLRAQCLVQEHFDMWLGVGRDREANHQPWVSLTIVNC